MVNFGNYYFKHNSSNYKFRQPLGAVKTGSEVTLIIESKRIDDLDSSANISIDIVLENEGNLSKFPMANRDATFVGKFVSPEKAGLYHYFFEVNIDNSTFFMGADDSLSNWNGGSPGSGDGKIYEHNPVGFQLTVFDKEFKTPDWSKASVMYQIFPDRYAIGDINNLKKGVEFHRNKGRRVIVHSNWNERPVSKAVGGYENYDPIDYYGGDFRGIINNLDKIAELGVNVIYLNPIVEAASNHRYNTGDYYMPDPILGSMEDFRELCDKAKSKGIKIILDGVFSHTGSDSRYFNKNNSYDECGAYQDSSSKYYSWYKFGNNRDDYVSWWGFKTLPEVNELDKSWQEMVVSGPDSVIKYWLRNGASGFRLDVADELPDEVIELMRTSLKEEGEDKLLIGEVWEDASTKESYGSRRQYCMGKGLDAVMNYPLRKAIVAYLSEHISGEQFKNFLLAQQNNYPKEMYYSQMNLLSSHDVARIRTVLGTDNEGDGLTRDEQGRYVMSNAELKKGLELSRLAYGIIFALPGMPCIYYGDEHGMTGFKDPFNREPFIENNRQMLEYIKQLSNVRNSHPALSLGQAGLLTGPSGDIIILRTTAGDEDAFGNEAKSEVMLSITNPSSEEHFIEMKFDEILEEVDGISEKAIRSLKEYLEKCDNDEKQISLTVGPRESLIISL